MSVSLRELLAHGDSPVRLQAAMTAGTNPAKEQIVVLVERCRIEEDFYVRDMLTWALVRHDTATVLDRLRPELASSIPQARSQALHTLSKIADPSTRGWITRDHLHDADDEVARAAWRAKAGLVLLAELMDDAHDGESGELLGELLAELGRDGFEVKRSLSRAIIELGEMVVAPLERLRSHPDPEIGAHAAATLQLYADPESSFALR